MTVLGHAFDKLIRVVSDKGILIWPSLIELLKFDEWFIDIHEGKPSRVWQRIDRYDRLLLLPHMSGLPRLSWSSTIQQEPSIGSADGKFTKQGSAPFYGSNVHVGITCLSLFPPGS